MLPPGYKESNTESIAIDTARATSALWVGIGVGTTFAVTVLLLGLDLLTRQMWMDEVHTWLIVTDPDIGHAMTALSRGADYNPPTYYLLLRLFTSITAATPQAMRTFSLLAMACGLGCVGALLRRRFSTLAAICGCATIGMQPLIIQQATEARFYSAWFALVAMFCLARSHCTVVERGEANLRGGSRLVQLLVQSALAAMICTVHYFGVISLGLVFLVDALNEIRVPAVSAANLSASSKSGVKHRARLVLWCVPYAAGVLAVAGCIGFYLGQRSSLTVATWISPPTIAKVKMFALEFLPVIPIGLAALGWVLSGGLEEHASQTPQTAGEARADDRQLSLLIAGLGMPVILILFSYTCLLYTSPSPRD